MGLRRLAGGCDDKDSCPGIWEDDRYPGDVIIVGVDLDPAPVRLGPGERAVRLERGIVDNAGLV